MKDLNTNKYERAKKRVNELKGFYIHLTVYIVINAFILVNVFVSTMADGESFWKWSHFLTLFFWGIGILFHAANTFKINPFFGKNWEKKQIQRFMEEDKKESKKYL